MAAASTGLAAAMAADAMPTLQLWLRSITRRSFALMPGGSKSFAPSFPGDAHLVGHARRHTASLQAAEPPTFQECLIRHAPDTAWALLHTSHHGKKD